MEVQNISAQLFTKQLPFSDRATYSGCKQDPSTNYLNTCVDDVKSDAAIENAFQKQLDLSEYYKSPGVFNSIKKDFMNQVMGNREEPEKVIPKKVIPKKVIPEKVIPSNSIKPLNHGLVKEGFGSTNKKGVSKKTIMYTVMSLAIIGILVFLLIKLKN
jgi:hypothetical protein